MDNNGIFSIDYLFSLFMLIIIAIAFLSYSENYIDTFENIKLNIEGRIILDKVANSINQINSNGQGYSKIIKLPLNISGKPYVLRIRSNEIIIDCDNKKGKSIIFPINLIDKDNHHLDQINLYNGEKYLIEKKIMETF